MKNATINQLLGKRNIWISPFIKGDVLEVSDDFHANYFIFNALGKFQSEGSLIDGDKIHVNTLSRGIYFIQFTFTDNSKITKQFMKY